MAETDVSYYVVAGRHETDVIALRDKVVKSAGGDSGFEFVCASITEKDKEWTLESLKVPLADIEGGILLVDSAEHAQSDLSAVRVANNSLPVLVVSKDETETEKILSSSSHVLVTQLTDDVDQLCDLFGDLLGEQTEPEKPKDPFQYVLMLGLSDAGKTTLVSLWAGNHPATTEPTSGFNVEELVVGGCQLRVWDLGGSESLRAYWKHYYPSTEALVYVIDSSSSEELLSESLSALAGVLSDSDMPAAAKLLVIATKQDAAGARSVDEIRSRVSALTSRASDVLPVSLTDEQTRSAALDALVQLLVADS